jgi:hypothetical protein
MRSSQAAAVNFVVLISRDPMNDIVSSESTLRSLSQVNISGLLGYLRELSRQSSINSWLVGKVLCGAGQVASIDI